MASSTRVDLAPGNRVALGRHGQRRPDRHRLAVVGLEVNGHHRHPQQPRDGSERLIEGCSQQTAVGQAWSALVVLGDQQLGVDRAALASGQRQVKPGRVVGSAAEALPVVAAERRAGRRRVHVARREARRGRAARWDACGLTARSRSDPTRAEGSRGCHPGVVPTDDRPPLPRTAHAPVVVLAGRPRSGRSPSRSRTATRSARGLAVGVGLAAFALAALGLSTGHGRRRRRRPGPASQGRPHLPWDAIGGVERPRRRRRASHAADRCRPPRLPDAARLGADGVSRRRRRTRRDPTPYWFVSTRLP